MLWKVEGRGIARGERVTRSFDVEVEAVTGDDAAAAGYRKFVSQNPECNRIMVGYVRPAEATPEAPPEDVKRPVLTAKVKAA